MAYSYTQNFNSLTTASLDGQDSWAKVGTSNCANVSEDSSARFEGAKGLKLQVTVGGTYRRTITNMTSGSMYYATRVDTNASSGDGAFIIHNLDATTSKYGASVKWISGASTLQYLKNTGWADLATSLTATTWYIVNMEFDMSTDQVRYRYKASGGAFSAFTSWESAYSTGTNTNLLATGLDSGVYSIDTISDSEPTPDPTATSALKRHTWW